MNSLCPDGEKRTRLMNEVYRVMKQEFYNTLCNRLGEGMAREKLIDHVKSVSDFDYCIGVHMELDEQTKRDTALNKFVERIVRMYMTRSGKIMGNFSSKTSEGNIVLSVSGTDNTDQVIKTLESVREVEITECQSGTPLFIPRTAPIPSNIPPPGDRY